jgi:hypothetical protein
MSPLRSHITTDVPRVVIVLCKLEEFQPQVWAIIKTFPDSVEVLVIYAVIASFYALSGEVLFGNLYRDLDTEYVWIRPPCMHNITLAAASFAQHPHPDTDTDTDPP